MESGREETGSRGEGGTREESLRFRPKSGAFGAEIYAPLVITLPQPSGSSGPGLWLLYKVAEDGGITRE